MRKALFLCMALAGASAARAAESVVGSRHDFSVSGPGPFRAVSEKSPCIFCHVSHNSGPLLTNRPDPTANHTPYDSSTVKNKPHAPSGATRVCLSCHDGTIAVGATRNGRIAMIGPDVIPAGHPANLGTDLRGGHPVSFRPGPAPGTHLPDARDAVRLDPSGEMQCTTCHDPHAERTDAKIGKFLVKPSGSSALCLSCHDTLAVTATGSSHALSSVRLGTTLGSGGFDTVAEAGCSACHPSHGADPRGLLLRAGRTDDDRCLACHRTGVAQKLVGADLAKPWNHSSEGRSGHDPAERLGTAAAGRTTAIPSDRRHVTCVDCHDPHAANPRRAQAPSAGGALAGVWGIDLNGLRVDDVRFEYEVCLKCHGDTAPPAQPFAGVGSDVRRAISDMNLRLVFSLSSPSSHPVAAPGRSTDVPSLRSPYTTASLVYCTDCHSSDEAASADPTSTFAGAGVRGPHGSIYPHLLERQYVSSDPMPESPASYALCYKCHDRDVLLSSGSAFPLHRRHVVDQSTPCATCHDGHGISNLAGNDRENAHLISFNTRVVSAPKGAARPAYSSDGPRHGSCALTCHGSTHDGPRFRY